MLYTWTRRLPNLISRSWKRSRRPTQRKPVARHKPAFEQLEDLTLLSTINWTGAASDNNWNSTGNWDLGRLPTASDDALIGPAFSGITITHSSSASDAVNNLNSQAAISLTGGSLTISATSTINGDLTLSAALAGAGDLTVNGLTTWTSGTMSGTGHTIADGGVSLSGALPKTLNARSLDNFGAAVWTGSGIVGSIILSNGAVWNNEPGSVFDYQLDVSASINNGGGITPPQFNNAGLLLKSASTGTMAVGVALNNTGTVQVSTGTVNLSGGGTSSGTFSVDSILIFSGGTFTMQSGAAFTGMGSVQVPTFGTLNVAGNVSLPNLVVNGGTLTGTGNVSVTNTLNWISGTMSGTGHTAASGTFTLNGSFLTLNARTIDNAGTATLAQGTSISTSNSAVWNNLASGTLDSQGDASFSSFAAGPLFNNAGLLRKSAGTGSTSIGMALNNTGTVQVSSGTLNLSGGGSNSGSFTIGAGDTVNFSGSTYILQAGSTFSGAGTVQIATFSTVNVAGDASMQALVIAGGAVTGHGTLTVNGLLTWSGGTMSGSGQTTANGGAAISGFATLDTRIFNNFATATLAATSTFSLANTAVWNNQTSGVLDVRGDVSISAAFGATPQLNNAGLLRKSAGVGTSTISAAVNNSGTLEVASGTVNLTAGGTDSGTFLADAGATLQFGGGTATLQTGVQLTGAGSVTVASFSRVILAGSVTAANLTINGGTLTGPGNLAAANLTFTGGTLSNTGTVTVGGLFTWSGGTMTGGGATALNGNTLLSSFVTLDTRTVNNTGSVTWFGSGFVTVNNAVWNNLPGSALNAQADVSFINFSGTPGQFNNQGVVAKLQGTGTTEIGLPFNNTGLVLVQSGTLNLSKGGTSSSQFNIPTLAAVLNLGGTFTLQAGATGTGAGNVQEGSFNTLVVAGDASLQNILMSGGTLTGAANLTVSGALTWSGGTMTGSGHTAVNGTMALSGFPTLDTRTLDNYGTAVWTGGGFVAANNGGVWNNQPGSLFDAQADASFVNFSGAPVQFNNQGLVRKSAGAGTTSLGVAFTNLGTVQVQTGTLSFGSLSNFAGGTLTGGTYILEAALHLNGDLQANAATIILDAPPAQITDVFGSSALASLAANAAAGVLMIQNGANLVTRVAFTNAGAVQANAGSGFTSTGDYKQTGGTTVLNQAATLTAPDVILSGGNLSGAGTVIGNLLNGAQVDPGTGPGILTVQGNYTQTAAGVLDIQIGGLVAGSQYDRLVVSGTATLDGAFNVTTLNGYLPNFGDLFQVLTFASHTGNFATFNGLDLGSYRLLKPVYNSNGLDLSLLTISSNHPPVVTAVANRSVNEGSLLTFTVSASDVDTNETLTLSMDSGAPVGATFDPKTGTFSWIPADGPAVYTVVFRATDNGLPPMSGTAAVTITVNNVPPTVTATGTGILPEGGSFSGSGFFTDPGADTWIATVDYGDGSGVQPLALNPDKTFNLGHAYADTGNYTVVVTVTDKDGGTGVSSIPITVTNVPPTLNPAPADQTANEGMPYNFDLGGFTDPGVHDGPWKVDVAWGDGGSDSFFAAMPGALVTLAHTYADDGTYAASVIVTDKYGASDMKSFSASVNNVPPTASITGAPVTSPEGTPISLGSTVTDPSPVDTAAGFTYAWSVTKDGAPYANGANANFSFTPDDEATYTVNLAVSDEDGATGYASQVIITVTNVAPIPTINNAPESSPVGTPINLTSTVFDPGQPDTFAYSWTVTQDGAPYASATDSTLSFTPGVIGSYVVSLMVADDDGAIGTDTRTINVFKLSTATTVVSSSMNSTSVSGENVTFTATVTVDSPGSTAAFYPTGTVTFYDNGTAIGTGTLSTMAGVTAAALTTNLLSTASHTITAAYTSGDANFKPSPASAPISQTVNQAAITVSVTTSVNPSVAGQSVTFIASVSVNIPGSTALADPTGTVTFADGNSTLGTATLSTSGGVTGASFSTSALGSGDHTITAFYAGDANFTSSNGSMTQTVMPAISSAPVITSFSGAAVVIPAETDSFSAAFTDTAPHDTYTASFAWGDNTSSPGTVSQANGAGMVTASHIYAATGTYKVVVIVTDLTASASSQAASFSATVTQSIYLLSTGANGALTVSGNGVINVPGVIQVDSNSSSALTARGNASITARQINVVGKVSKSGRATLHPAAHTGASVLLDPLAALTAPAAGSWMGSINLSGTASLTISPGVYGQITLSDSATLTLRSGVYVIAGGGLSVTGNASLTGSGVVIYNAGSNFPNGGGNFGAIALSGGTVNLSAPTSGPYAGVVLFQARDNTRALSLTGNGVLGMTGTIYAPTALISLSGSAQVQAALTAYALTISGNGASTITADGNSSADAGVGQLLGGNIFLYVDSASNGGFSSAENARIQDAIAGIDGLLENYGVSITRVSAADQALANFVLDTDETTANGSASQGVLGSTKMSGEITIVRGWDWYVGSDPAGIQPDQYDFQTVVTHELGHALGLGHSNDAGSVMYATLFPGQAKRTLIIADLAVPDLEQETYAHPLLAGPFVRAGTGENSTSPLQLSHAGPVSSMPLLPVVQVLDRMAMSGMVGAGLAAPDGLPALQVFDMSMMKASPRSPALPGIMDDLLLRMRSRGMVANVPDSGLIRSTEQSAIDGFDFFPEDASPDGMMDWWLDQPATLAPSEPTDGGSSTERPTSDARQTATRSQKMLDVHMEDGDPVVQQTEEDADALAALLTNRGQAEEDLSRLAAATDSVFADQGAPAATMDAVGD